MAVSGVHSGAVTVIQSRTVAMLVSGAVRACVVSGARFINSGSAACWSVVVAGSHSFGTVVVCRTVSMIHPVIAVSGTVLVIYSGTFMVVTIVRAVVISVVWAILVVIYSGTSPYVMSRTGV